MRIAGPRLASRQGTCAVNTYEAREFAVTDPIVTALSAADTMCHLPVLVYQP